MGFLERHFGARVVLVFSIHFLKITETFIRYTVLLASTSVEKTITTTTITIATKKKQKLQQHTNRKSLYLFIFSIPLT